MKKAKAKAPTKKKLKPKAKAKAPVRKKAGVKAPLKKKPVAKKAPLKKKPVAKKAKAKKIPIKKPEPVIFLCGYGHETTSKRGSKCGKKIGSMWHNIKYVDILCENSKRTKKKIN